VCCLKFALIPTVTEPPRGGVRRQDQRERFSATRANCDRTTSGRGSSSGSMWAILGDARTQSTHISTIPYIEVRVNVITTSVHVLIIQKRFEAKITLQEINQSLRKCCRPKPTDGRWQATREPGGPEPLSVGPATHTRPEVEVHWACHLTYTWSGRCLMCFS
jgi:hypothetical protein